MNKVRNPMFVHAKINMRSHYAPTHYTQGRSHVPYDAHLVFKALNDDNVNTPYFYNTHGLDMWGKPTKQEIFESKF